ncbi:MAG: hypothetical protein DRG59_09440 [Deltaproteobacteria bacterium]|nr:MAG: hypothetical protein DRG59_09440 [Deltaproteobacteria bacterium]
MEKTILHLKIDDICLKLEALREPRLEKVPFAVGVLSDRAVIQAASSGARSCGIYPGMSVSLAKKRCRSLVIVPPDTSFYQNWQNKIFHHLLTLSPVVEMSGWGHFYVDLTGTQRLWGNPVDTAYRSQRYLKKKMDLEARAGIGANKLVSQVASTLVPPFDICEVFPGSESRFMAPLNPQVLPGVGAITRKRLHELNIHSLGEISNVPDDVLRAVFGSHGVHLRNLAQGKGETKINVPSRVPRIRIRWILPEEENNREILLAHVMAISEKLGFQIRRENRVPHLIKLEIVYADGAKASGQKTLQDALLHIDHFIFMTLKEIFNRIHKRRIRIRELTVYAQKFSIPFRQLSLFPWDENKYQKEEKLTSALDSIRSRFGFKSILRGQTFTLPRAVFN